MSLESAQGSRPPLGLRIAETAMWLSFGASLLLIRSFGAITDATVAAALGALVLVFGLQAFVRHGGGHITALGVLNLSVAIVVGYSGISHGLGPPNDMPMGYVAMALGGTYMVVVAATSIDLRRAAAPRILPVLPVTDGRWATRAGWVVLLATVVTANVEVPTLYGAVPASAFSAVVLIAVGWAYQPDSRLLSRHSVGLAAGFAIYTGYLHSGTGRLHIVSLALACAVVVAARFPSRRVKAGILLGSPLALALLAVSRLRLRESITSGVVEGSTGLESMTSSLTVFAEIIQRQQEGALTLAWGKTYTTFAFELIPVSALPTRPNAFGYELVAILYPDRSQSGWSIVASGFGEWVYNFSFVGLVAMVPVLLLALRWLDRRFFSAVLQPEGRIGLVMVAASAMLIGSLGDFVWSGMHTYTARMLQRLPILILVGLVGSYHARSWPSSNKAPRMPAGASVAVSPPHHIGGATETGR